MTNSQIREHFVWVEKYRPQTLDECILPESIRQTFLGVLASEDLPNLILAGKAGTGKTTVAKAICRQLDAETMVINASDENGIDLVRTRIKDFASAMSLDGRRRYVILDEADYLAAASTQPALRSFMEEFSRVCGFILTCNYVNRIIPALQSRCSIVEFKVPAAERVGIMTQFAKRSMEILDKENVTYSKKVLAGAVQQFYPDFRRILNELQRFSINGTLSEGILAVMSDKDINELFAVLRTKEYAPLRAWVTAHEDMSDSAFYQMMHEQLPERVDLSCLPQLIVLLADYAYKSAFTADKQLNVLACLLEIQNDGRFK